MTLVFSLINSRSLSLRQKLLLLPWGLVVVVTLLAVIGILMLLSASGGNLDPWAFKQMLRFAAGFTLMIVVAVTNIKVWLRSAWLVYAAGLLLLIAVKFQGTIEMGAQRWLDLGIMKIQPSELMKLGFILVMARYFDSRGADFSGRLVSLVIPILLVIAPISLIIVQPDLGTAVIFMIATFLLLFVVGLSWRIIGAICVMVAAATPFAWHFLHDYQKERILVFLNPSRDPLGTGYNIIQSKIALGSGGLTGKGYMLGTQSHLNFLPEKQTDFIFTMLGEEFGLLGGMALLLIYGVLFVYGFSIATRAASRFGRLVALGVTFFLFLNVFVNVAMVMGMIPAKGVPLPFVSYGGSSLVVMMIGIGLMMSVWVHRDARLGPGGVE
ncbi:MAG: rod shape-determining protein RodA [Alphaproteobacteria bacterium]|nr:rod shape-determining protein RodA [Alphaproteobacteria bacterium]